MKKILICALAVGMFTACSQEETISTQAPTQISFAGAFVENATRADKATDPSTTTDKLTAFDVWGFMDTPDGVIFENEDVTGTQGNFSYANTQYWVANHDYYFAALAPMNSPNVTVTVDKSASANKYGLGTVKFTITDGAEDLLYAAAYKKVADAIPTEAVKFQFNHLLSKVKFTFKNGFTNSNAKIVVEDIKMEAPYGPGKINLNQENWWTENHWILERPTSQKKALAFGNAGEIAAGKEQECANERLIFPTSVKSTIDEGSSFDGYKVTFTAKLYNGEVLAGTYNHEIKVTGVDFKIGKAYDLVAELNATNIDPSGEELKPIVFDVQEVKTWEEGDAAGVGQNVHNEDELIAAIAAGGHIHLAADITLTKALEVKVNTTLNLNGYDIVAPSSDAIIVSENANLTVNGEGDVKAATDNKASANALWVKHGNVFINGGNWYVGADNAERNDCIYVGSYQDRANAANLVSSVTIYGGTFEAKVEESNQYWVLNLRDEFYANGSKIIVKGGTYTKFNPANNLSEGANTNFVAEGYVSTETATGSNVWKVTAKE